MSTAKKRFYKAASALALAYGGAFVLALLLTHGLLGNKYVAPLTFTGSLLIYYMLIAALFNKWKIEREI